MSIKDRQLKLAADEAVKAELLAGRSPDSVNVERRLTQSLQGRTVGAPRYVFTPVAPDERSNPVAFNNSIHDIHEDLVLAFEEVGDQNDTVMTMSNMYETEKRMLQLTLHKTLRRIDTLTERLDNRSKRQIIDGTFRTFNEIDFEGNERQGVPETDAFIDLESGSVSLRNIASGIIKHDISDATYSIENQKLDDNRKPNAVEERPFTNVLRDTVNEYWSYVVTKDKVEETYVDVLVELPEKKDATRLTLTLHSPKTTAVTLYLSEDKVSWKELKSYVSYEKVDWTFDVSTQYIKIRFKKSEPDFQDGTTMEYFFGASNLSLKRETYARDSRLVSVPYPVDTDTIDKITLVTEEGVAPQTAINYYVGTDDGVNFVEWQEIEPGQTINLHQLARESIILNERTDDFGVKTGENFGLEFYALASLGDAPIERKTRLYAGEYMWKAEMKRLTGDIPELFMPSYSDWQDLRGVETSYLPVEDTYGDSGLGLTGGTLQRFTTYIQCVREENVYNAEFSIGSAYHQVYVNNSLIKPIVRKDYDGDKYVYNYRFKEGWNKIEVLTYTKETTTVLEDKTSGAMLPPLSLDSPLFKPNLYLRSISTKVYADNTSMREVSVYDLYNNTSKRAIDRFAIDGGRILINYDPVALDIANKGVRYVLDYEYLPTDARLVQALRFMSVLSRQDISEHITPILKGYKLILE